MYTIKVNTFRFVENKKKLESMLFIEGECISATLFSNLDFEKYKSKNAGKTFKEFVSHIEKRNKVEGTFHVNSSENGVDFMIIRYYGENGGVNYMIVYSCADIFILQKGKTIDKISV